MPKIILENYLNEHLDGLKHLHPANKHILGLTIKIIHFIMSFVAAFGPYVTNNIKLLSLLVVYYITVVTVWYVYGYCCCTTIEKKLETNVAKGNNKSFITAIFENIIGTSNSENIAYFILSLIPLVNTFVCLYKINYFCKNKLK